MQEYSSENKIEITITNPMLGVPITYLDKHNPEQFEIVGGSANGLVPQSLKIGNFNIYNNPIIGNKKIYQRILIRKLII